MTYVVSKRCDGCMHTECVDVCPVDAFYEGENKLFIHPGECIDCTACMHVCPESAIYPESNLPMEYFEDLKENEIESGKCENIIKKKTAKKKTAKKKAVKRKIGIKPYTLSAENDGW